jgi:hypothetical protein
VRLTQYGAPFVAEPPEWADEFASWTAEPKYLFPGELSGYVYMLRVGRRIWEVRVANRADHTFTEAEVMQLIDAVGLAAGADTAELSN